VRYLVSVHEGSQPGVVNLSPPDGVCYHEFSPQTISVWMFGEHCDHSLKHPDSTICLFDAQSQAAASRCRSRADIPEFGDVLEASHQHITLGHESADRLADDSVAWISSFDEPEEDVCIDQDDHQSWSS
jgi:hypothetical protein